MDLNDARELAKFHMKKHLADDSWTFKFNNRKRAFGVCYTTRKVIELSRILTAGETEDATEQTILHEIAHALTPGEGHNRKWKAVARSIGVRNPKSTRAHTAKDEDRPEPTWVCLLDDKEIVSRFYRKPVKTMRTIHKRMMRGRPETVGRLTIVPYAAYLKAKS